MSLLDEMPPIASLRADEVMASVAWALEHGDPEFFERKISRRGNVLTVTVRVRTPPRRLCAPGGSA